jgi:hypothetical protein
VRKGAIRGYLVSNFFDLMMWKVVKVVLPDAVTALLKVAMLSVGEEERSKEGGCLAKRCMREMKRSREAGSAKKMRGCEREFRDGCEMNQIFLYIIIILLIIKVIKSKF